MIHCQSGYDYTIIRDILLTGLDGNAKSRKKILLDELYQKYIEPKDDKESKKTIKNLFLSFGLIDPLLDSKLNRKIPLDPDM